MSANSTGARAKAPPDPNTRHRCIAAGCTKTTMRGAGEGLSYSYCRSHVDHIARHGSSWRKSLSGEELAPFRRAAKRWLEAHAAAPLIAATLRRLDRMMVEAGPIIIAPYLHSESPQSRAKQTLARMREKGATALTILTEALAVAVALRTLDGIPRDDDYHLTQLGKRAHRLGSAFTIKHGYKVAWRWHPEPRGQVLRHLGRMMREALDHGLGRVELDAVAALAAGKAA